MAKTPEAKVKANIKKILKEHNIYYAMPMGTGYGNAGVPDFLCCVKGKFVAVEAKTVRNNPTELQKKNLAEIEASGGMTWVVNELTINLFEVFIKVHV